MYKDTIKNTGIALTLLLSVAFAGPALAAQDAQLIPDGAVPGFVPHAYDAMNEAGKKYAGAPYINIYKELYGKNIPLHEYFPPSEDPFVSALNKLPPADANEKARECIEQKCLGTLKGDMFFNVISVFEAMRYDGLRDGENGLHAFFVDKYDPDKKYTKWEHGIMQEAAAALANDAAFKDNISQWVPIGEITADNAEAQYRLHRDGLQMASDAIRKAFRLPPALIVLDNFADLSGIGGAVTFPPEMTDGMTGGKHLIVLDYSYISSGMSVQDFIGRVAHETKHSVDQELARQLITGNLKNTDMRFRHTAAIIFNGHAYQNMLPAAITQYTERSAEKFGNEFSAQLMDFIKNGTPLPDKTPAKNGAPQYEL